MKLPRVGTKPGGIPFAEIGLDSFELRYILPGIGLEP